jgi:hypothetical protein
VVPGDGVLFVAVKERVVVDPLTSLLKDILHLVVRVPLGHFKDTLLTQNQVLAKHLQVLQRVTTKVQLDILIPHFVAQDYLRENRKVKRFSCDFIFLH